MGEFSGVLAKRGDYPDNLRNRLFNFSVTVIKFLMKLPYRKELEVFKSQLSRSATAIGANFEEAQSTSYKEFVQKMRIALREANESKYWLSLLSDLQLGDMRVLRELIKECGEICLILGSIVSRASKRINTK